jgi:hypothetical protein
LGEDAATISVSGMSRKFLLAIFGFAAVSGCGTPPKGIEILVSTAPPGASCLLIRGGQPIATAEPTPAIAIVPIDAAPVSAQCRRLGFEDAAAVVPPAALPSSPWFGYPVTEYRSAVLLVMTPRLAALPQ